MERLQKVIASSGYCSRRKAEELIGKGLVTVNGETVREMGVRVGPKDEILVEGNAISKEAKEYYLLYKPRGVVTTVSDDKHRKTVVDLIPTTTRIYPVGRLDYDTTGVLILTNDGTLANGLMHPKNRIDKCYVAKVKGVPDAKGLKLLQRGIVVDRMKVRASRVKMKKVDKKNNTCMIYLTIHDGRNHQVKKMLECIGSEVLKLKRESVSFLTLDGLNSGEYRRLNPKEIHKLYHEIGINQK
mgnify:FL=1